MTLALFDLDNTLIAGDSDHLWGDFLVEREIVDQKIYKEANDAFYEDYVAGRLDIHAYLRFALDILKRHPRAQLHQWRDEFLREKIEPCILPAARSLIDEHRALGHTLLIITATNDFVTGPIAERLGVDNLLATEVEPGLDGYTGDIRGIPCYRDGKVEKLNNWLGETGASLEQAWFYSDSHNDLPLLQRVDHPVAVDADATLADEARSRGWRQITLRSE